MYTILQEQADIAATSKSSKNVVSKEQSAEIAKEKVSLIYFLLQLCGITGMVIVLNHQLRLWLLL
jgi:hypothetical protein